MRTPGGGSWVLERKTNFSGHRGPAGQGRKGRNGSMGQANDWDVASQLRPTRCCRLSGKIDVRLRRKQRQTGKGGRGPQSLNCALLLVWSLATWKVLTGVKGFSVYLGTYLLFFLDVSASEGHQKPPDTPWSTWQGSRLSGALFNGAF